MTIRPTEPEAAEVQLFREIDALNSQVAELQDYLATLRNPPIIEPAPQGMLTPKEIIEQAQKTVRQQQDAAAKQAEAAAIRQSLLSLERQLSEKRSLLKELKNQETLNRLLALAVQYNEAVDLSVRLLEDMKKVNIELGGGGLEITADLIETAYASIRTNSIKIRRRYDVLREN